MKILFIRHSKTVLDQTHSNLVWKLSEDGVQAAEQLSHNDLIKQCQVMYSSLQTKALETALILAKNNNIPIKTLADLTETTSVTNGFFENFAAEMEKWHMGEYRINNGETKAESLQRFNLAIQQIMQSENSIDMLGVVAHGNVLAIFSQQFIDQSSYAIHKQIAMPDIALFDVETQKFSLVWGNL
jgi:broad specificity phosphatase PhoE